MSKLFIAVRQGRQPGIYAGWDFAKPQVHRFSGQQFKGFDSYEEAHAYLHGAPWQDGSAFVQLSFDDGRVVRFPVSRDDVEALIS